MRTAFLLALVAGAALPGVAGAALSPSMASKVAPSLVRAAQDAPGETLSVWVTFSDKGEQGPADLSRRLSEAAASLSPRAHARRIRARVMPFVDYRDLPLHPPYLEGLARQGLRCYGASRWLNGTAARFPGWMIETVAALPFVQRLAPVERMRHSHDPEAMKPLSAPPAAGARAGVDYGFTASQLGQIQLPALHDSGYTGAGILVCLLDAGFNYFDKHEALRDHVIPAGRQRDFHRGLQTAQDTTDGSMVHGTQVMGCIAGRKFGTYVGAAFDAEYALGRTEVLVTETPQEMVYWGMGAEWADSLGADIISSSLGYFTFDDTTDNYTYADMDGHTTVVSRAAEIAASKGILIVNAVGNEGSSAWHYLIAPSDVHGDSVIAVGAVDAAGAPTSFSSWGPSADGRVKPDVAARGLANPIVSASGNPQGYGSLSGTSFATPLVAGLAACLMQARPQWSPRDVARALRATASKASAPDMRVGYGVANGLAALSYDPGLGVGERDDLSLRYAGPNPVAFERGPAWFTFAAASDACNEPGSIRVYDAQGRRVRELWTGVVSCGLPSLVAWDGRDDEGRITESGLYFVRLAVGAERATLRLIALR
jgi:serine protease AprX